MKNKKHAQSDSEVYNIKKEKPASVSEPPLTYGTSSGESPLTFEKVWMMFQETDKKFQETERLLKESSQETDRQFQETDKKIKELSELFTGQWGKLVEALVAPGCLKLFQERGIQIFQCFPNVAVQKNGRQMEIDLMLVNDTELVVVEIKTTARVKHIKELLNELKAFKTFFPRYADCKVFGAIAAVRFEEGCDRFAESQRLFVIKTTGEGLVKIINDKNFAPKAF